ncbi:unnamed protein product [Cuscuta europaea]|uniref:GATA-type domain-containing protein n=1 Tax=Cuscuta europaea TaxID=41803 RepID=A0A9P0ZNJ2_CUSEU|nr:unnamed protein product [Cuscuta europaea]
MLSCRHGSIYGGPAVGNAVVSPAVDCTLSLATPSSTPPRRRSMPHFVWDVFSPPSQPLNRRPTINFVHKLPDSNVVPRRCTKCRTTSTPLWRNGPRGPKSLCNACGIRYRKEERRVYDAATTVKGSGSVVAASETMMNTSDHHHHHHEQAQKKGCFSTTGSHDRRKDLRLMDVSRDHHRDSDVVSCSWRHLSNVGNVPGRPAVVYEGIMNTHIIRS